jgi:DNA-binding MarR family transcriptional regulator
MPGRPSAGKPARRLRAANLAGAWALAVADAADDAVHAALGQGGAAPAALVAIHDSPGQSIERLRPTLGLSQPGAARLVDRLVAAGWVRRSRGADARTAALSLTVAGRRVVARILRERERRLERLLDPLSDEQADQLAELLGAMLRSQTHDDHDLRRLCRLCDRPVCDACPVAEGARLSGAD